MWYDRSISILKVCFLSSYLRSLMKWHVFCANNWSFNCNFISVLHNMRSISTFARWSCILFNWVLFNCVEDLGALSYSNLTCWWLGMLERSLCSMIVHLLLILDKRLTPSLFWGRCSWCMSIAELLLLFNVLLQIVSFASAKWRNTTNDLGFTSRHSLKFQRHRRWLVLTGNSTCYSSTWMISSDSTLNRWTIFDSLVISLWDSWLVFCLWISNWDLCRFSSIFVNWR